MKNIRISTKIFGMKVLSEIHNVGIICTPEDLSREAVVLKMFP
jgi:hypothetical protein